jgi:predicted transposase YbfD/YdcC
MMTQTRQGHLSIIRDPRQAGKVDHRLSDIVMLSICATVGGAEGWLDIEEFGRTHERWFCTQGLFDNGIPVGDTVARVMSMLSPKAFQTAFIAWMQDVAALTHGEVIAVDGKTLRRSHDRKARKAPLHMVSAFACSNGVVLGQERTEEKSNEITAIPSLLALSGCFATIDAMGCQKAIAKQITQAKGDYVLAVKDNQRSLHEAITDWFDVARADDFKHAPHDFYEQTDKGHGRVEVRRYWLSGDLSGLAEPQRWAGLRSIGMAENETHHGGKCTIERRYFITTLSANAQQFAHAVRNHWGIENRLHWVLDMSFREDECRIRRGDGAEILGVVRHIALNLLRQDKTSKRGIKGKRYKAALDINYAAKVLEPILA